MGSHGIDCSARRGEKRSGRTGSRGKGRQRGRELARLKETPGGIDLPRGFIWALYVDLSPHASHLRGGVEKGGGGRRRREGACCALHTLRDKIFRGTVNVGSPVVAGSYQGEEGSGRPLQLPMAIFRPNTRHRPESFHARARARVHSLARYSVTCNRTAINRGRVYCRSNGRIYSGVWTLPRRSRVVKSTCVARRLSVLWIEIAGSDHTPSTNSQFSAAAAKRRRMMPPREIFFRHM